MIGSTVGKYRILDRLGRGGMGTVYRAVDETLDREVAIKVLNPDLSDADVLKRFRAEAITLARLNHPGIATLYELHRHDDDLLMVMEYVRGETFHDLSERLGPLAPPQAAHLCMQVLEALAHAHRAGVVHRDLKPANLMVTETGTVKVMDFGIARVLGTEQFTHGGYMMGTPAYMAPEQVLGRDIDGRADLYAVGVVLYRLLTGQLPFDADTAIAMVQKQISEPPRPIASVREDLPGWCSHVIERALAKTPAERFQSAGEFRAALLLAVQPQALGELPTMATPTPPGLMLDPELTVGHDPAGFTTPATVARAQPVTRSAAEPAPAAVERTTGTTVVLGRTHLAAIAGLIIVLVGGIAVLGFVVLRQGTLPQQLPLLGTLPQRQAPVADAAPPAESQPSSAPTVDPPNPAASPATPARRDVAATAGAGTSQPIGAAPATSDGRTAPVTDAGGRGGRGTNPGKDAGPAANAPAAAAGASSAAAPAAVSFGDIRVLVTDPGNKGREREAVLRLGDGRVSVLERVDGPSIAAVPYSDLVGAFYSRSKQPKWKDSEGREVQSKVDLGRLGFFRGERNWIILITRSEPLIFRIDDSAMRTVLPALTEHTGVQVRR